MKEIELTQGHWTKVSDLDYPRFSAEPWFADVRKTGQIYARRNVRGASGKRQAVYLHTLLVGNPGGEVDHKNGDTLDNRRSNLRVATPTQNRRNMRKIAGCTSRFKGVHWHSGAKKWQARIAVARRTKSLGLFVSELDAADAYDTAAKSVFKEFARLNFPGESS